MHLSWLARLPGALFGVTFGLFGLSGAWYKAAAFGWLPAAAIGDALFGLTCLVWAVLLVLYAAKCVLYRQAAVNEFLHPVAGPLIVLLPLSALLIVVQHPHLNLWMKWAIVAAAMLLQGAIALRVVFLLATGRIAADMVTPALYLPVVGGGFISGMAMAALDCRPAGALLFGMGLAGWAMLEVRVLHRLFQGPLPAPWRPTIAIELSPPTVAPIAAAMIWPGLPAEVLNIGLGICVVSAVAILARHDWWRMPFSAGFWSFSFPLAAFAAGAAEAIRRGGWSKILAAFPLALASLVIAFLAVRTLMLLAEGRLLPVEPPALSASEN